MLPTIEEYRLAAQRYHRLGYGLAVLLFCAFVAWGPMTSKLEPMIEGRFGKGVEQMAMTSLTLGILPLMLLSMWLIEQQYKRFPLLRCPNCRDSLGGPRRYKLVIASHHCPHCGEQVARLADDAVSSSKKPAPLLPPFEAYVAEHKQCARLSGKWSTRLVVALFGSALLGLVVGRVAEPWLGPVMAKALPAICFAACLPLLPVCHWKMRSQYKRFATLQCSHCDTSLYESKRIVKATRHCIFCGRQVIREPVDAAND